VHGSYLETVAEAGLLQHFDGSRYVAGEFVDPISGERQCLIEYCHPCLLATTPTMEEFARMLAARFPDADALVLRAPAEVKPPRPWERRLTFVRYAGKNGAVPSGVVLAAAEHEALTARWLRQALTHAYCSQGRSPSQAAVASTASQIMAAPDRRTYIAISGSTPVGHVTVLSDRLDEVTGESIVELYDLLVETSNDRGGVTGRLVAAAASHAATLGRPLIGNVVHQPAPKSDTREHGLRVLEGLLSRGWEPDHVFWSARARDIAS
jgi:hypothetical protein